MPSPFEIPTSFRTIFTVCTLQIYALFPPLPLPFSATHALLSLDTLPTSQPPPKPPVAWFSIYGHQMNTNQAASVYPFLELPTGGPPSLQDAHHDALVLVSAPYHLAPAPFASLPPRLSDPAPFPGSGVPPPRIIPSHPSYYPQPDLTRDTHERKRERIGRRVYSPDRNHHPHYSSSHAPENREPTNDCLHRGGSGAACSHSSTTVNPHGVCRPVTPAPPPRMSLS